MKKIIRYLNTDLDLLSAKDLAPLATALAAADVPPLSVTHHTDGLWYATFETAKCQQEPETSIALMLTAVESLSLPMRRLWKSCSRCEFNIGYDCGQEPWAFNQGLSAELLGRMAALGASLRITIYPQGAKMDVHDIHSNLQLRNTRSKGATKMKTKSPAKVTDGAKCTVVGGVHAGKAGVVRDIKTGKTGHVSITVVQANGERFKTLARNVEISA